MNKLNWKSKIVENVLSKKNWAFYCVAGIVMINSAFNLGISGDDIDRLVWLAVGLFAGDGLAKLGEGMGKMKSKNSDASQNK